MGSCNLERDVLTRGQPQLLIGMGQREAEEARVMRCLLHLSQGERLPLVGLEEGPPHAIQDIFPDQYCYYDDKDHQQELWNHPDHVQEDGVHHALESYAGGHKVSLEAHHVLPIGSWSGKVRCCRILMREAASQRGDRAVIVAGHKFERSSRPRAPARSFNSRFGVVVFTSVWYRHGTAQQAEWEWTALRAHI